MKAKYSLPDYVDSQEADRLGRGDREECRWGSREARVKALFQVISAHAAPARRLIISALIFPQATNGQFF